MAEEQVHGPEDSIVVEMTKQLPQENIFRIVRCFQARKVRKRRRAAGILHNWFSCGSKLQNGRLGSATTGRSRCTSVMSKWYATFLRLHKEKELEGWWQLHEGGVGGISSQHLQVFMTQILQKTLGATGRQEAAAKKRPSYVARMDNKTAFDMARPKQIATIVGA